MANLHLQVLSLVSQSQHVLLLKFLSRLYSCPRWEDLQLHCSVVLSAAVTFLSPFACRHDETKVKVLFCPMLP